MPLSRWTQSDTDLLTTFQVTTTLIPVHVICSTQLRRNFTQCGLKRLIVLDLPHPFHRISSQLHDSVALPSTRSFSLISALSSSLPATGHIYFSMLPTCTQDHGEERSAKRKASICVALPARILKRTWETFVPAVGERKQALRPCMVCAQRCLDQRGEHDAPISPLLEDLSHPPSNLDRHHSPSRATE